MKNHIDVKRFQTACTVAFFLFMLLCAVKEKMLVTQEYQGWVVKNYKGNILCLYLLFAAGICLLILWKGKIQDKKKSAVCAGITILLMPTVNFYIFEMTVGNFETIMQNTRGIILLNLCIWYLLYAVVFMICNSVKYTILLLSSTTYLVAVANAFVVAFRQKPIMLMDLRTIGTAMSVAGEYAYDISANMVVMALGVMLCCLWGLKLEFRLPDWKFRIGYTGTVLLCVAGVFYSMLAGGLLERAGLKNLNFFRLNESYKSSGYMLCTIKTMQYLQIEKGEEYSVKQVQEIAENVEKQRKTEEDLPENILVIMNESFADLSVLGELETSVPVFSNFYNAKGNVQNGKVYVSAFGGGTPNSEYEFLTGNSLAFLPMGTVPYQMYVKEGDSSIVKILKNNGYKTIAYHPYRKENYNRPKVYDVYGFDTYYAMDDFKTKKIRNYPSDKSDYKALIKMHKAKEPGENFLYLT